MVMKTYVVETCDPSEACTGTDATLPPRLHLRSTDKIVCEERKLCVPATLPPLPRDPPPTVETDISAPETEGPSETPENETDAREGGGCAATLGISQVLPLSLAGLIGGLALLRRRES